MYDVFPRISEDAAITYTKIPYSKSDLFTVINQHVYRPKHQRERPITSQIRPERACNSQHVTSSVLQACPTLPHCVAVGTHNPYPIRSECCFKTSVFGPADIRYIGI